jgi:hypothetical protein
MCEFWARKKHRYVTLRIPRKREANNIIYVNSRSNTYTTRGSVTSVIVWFVTLLLRALLLDEL